MGRAPCCDKTSVKKGPWSPEEDAKLKEFINKHGTGGNWIALPHKAGLKRCGKSCRLRWLNYLRPNIKHGEFSEDEDRIICSLYASIGSRWSIIAGQLPGRTDNDIKNYWNTKLRKKLLAMLPSFQKKPSFFPSIPLQSLPLPDHHKYSDNFMNSSSFYNDNPSFLNVSNSLLPATGSNLVHNHMNITDLFSPPSSNALIGMSSNNYYPVFQCDQSMNKEYYYPEVKERMLMFGGGGGGGELSTTCSSSDGGGSCMSQISYQYQHRIKQEDQFALRDFGYQRHGFMTDHNYVDQKPKGYFKNHVNPPHNNLEEAKQLTDINSSSSVNISSYLINDDENKTTRILTDGCYMMIDGSN
ncbi:hypothetical protein L1887_18986 [Cichorium endivia]|nr:hypothetical protein L1887_18986 [Cichorium endivia]